MSGIHGVQNTVLGPLKQELRIVRAITWVLGTDPGSSARAASVLSPSAISLAPSIKIVLSYYY